MAEPRVRFLLGGMQKAGTSALASYLSAHPHLRLPARKEAHVFDAPDFDDAWTSADIDARFAAHFADWQAPGTFGDATPITVFHPRLVERVARYNPAMRWVLLLRDPVERAISQYFMERGRGQDTWPLWAAIAGEALRLHGHRDDFSRDSPLRRWSYLARGRYSRQLDALFLRFPREQVLLLRSDELAADPQGTVARVLGFLHLEPLAGQAREPRAYERVFEGSYRPPRRWAPGRLLARLLLARDIARLRRRYGIDLTRPRVPAPNATGAGLPGSAR
jgi:hypothetical protein